MSLSHLIHQNLACLEQGLRLLDDLDDAAYQQDEAPMVTSSISAHLRHCLEHYVCFLDGIPGGRVDYDARLRDRRIEQDRTYARAVLQGVMHRLARLTDDDRVLHVKLDCDVAEEGDSSSQGAASTMQRELQYLVAHTIHHFALIAVILRLKGHVPDERFGVAPSTLKYYWRQPEAAS